MADDRDIERAIVELLAARAPQASICPSEVARTLFAPQWRDAMPRVRGVASGLAQAGRIGVTQGDAVIAPAAVTTVSGPIRLRRGPRFEATDD